MRRTLAKVIALTMLSALIGPMSSAHAAPRASAQTRPMPLADLNGNRLSDNLEASLSSAAPSDRLEVVVQTTAPRPRRHAERLVGTFDVIRALPSVGGFAATMTASQIESLARSPKVLRIDPNTRVVALNDRSNDDFGTAAARAAYGVDGSGVGICVADTGADPNHEQLDGNIVGWKDFVRNAPQPYDDHWHGTHVAATAAGDGTGGSLAARFQGVASGADLYIAKVLDGNGSGSEADIIAGIDWCATRGGVDIISLSIGTLEASDGQDAMSQAVNDAVLTHGKTVVVAAGNSGEYEEGVGSPGAAAEAISVGAVTKYSGPASSGYHTEGVYLAYFSSRGPVVGSGAIKPDVVAPGVNTMSATAGSTATYNARSGTSMATPFVAGTAALALHADPTLTPAQVKALIEGTAQDRGPAGKDIDWGAGLIDGFAVVSEADGVGTYDPTAFPTHTHVYDKVSRNGQWTYTFDLTADDLDVPIAATIILDGQLTCVSGYGPWCFAFEHTPDLDAELLDPTGSQIALSQCALGAECSSGRQETLHAMPTVPGTYTIRVWPFAGDPNDGKGGWFNMDLSRGPVGVGTPPPPPSNQAPNAADDAYATDEGVALTTAAPGVLANDGDPDGDPITALKTTDPSDGSVTLSADGSFTYTPDPGFTGQDSFTYVADDGSAQSAPATVTITVDPVGGGGTSIHVGDLDTSSSSDRGNWTATVTVTVHDDGHASVQGATVSVSWSTGGSSECTTDASGTCTVDKTQKKKVGSVTATVTGVVGPAAYDHTQNHDPDGDSDGTAIVASKP